MGNNFLPITNYLFLNDVCNNDLDSDDRFDAIKLPKADDRFPFEWFALI